MKPELKDFVSAWMPLIDDSLSNAQRPIPDRVFAAACWFVKHVVTAVSSGTKDDCFETLWFAAIYRETSAWYAEKYAAALERPADFFLGVCLHSGATLELHIPGALKRVEKEGDTFWLIFPRDVQEEDRPASWIVRSPNIDAMVRRERQLLLTKVVTVGTCLRSIHLDLMTAEKPDMIAEGLASNIVQHLKTSAAHILEPRQTSLGLCCWEAHQAAEKSLKLLSRQKAGTHQRTHELKTLCVQIDGFNGLHINGRLVRKLPTERQAIMMRASEGPTVSVWEAYRIYFASLWLARQCAAAMPRKTTMLNARFLLKKPPYLD
jgi:hypothetical protein